MAQNEILVSSLSLNSNDPSAIVDISSTTQGVLIPRMNSQDKILIPSPATGLLIYDTEEQALEVWGGTTWNAFITNNGNRLGSWLTIGTQDPNHVYFINNNVNTLQLTLDNNVLVYNHLQWATDGLGNIGAPATTFGPNARPKNAFLSGGIATGDLFQSPSTVYLLNSPQLAGTVIAGRNSSVSALMGSGDTTVSGYHNDFGFLGFSNNMALSHILGFFANAAVPGSSVFFSRFDAPTIRTDYVRFSDDGSVTMMRNSGAHIRWDSDGGGDIGFFDNFRPNFMYAKAGVGIGLTSTMSLNAALEVTSTTQGVLLPRLTTDQRDDIPTPDDGLLLYNTDTSEFEFFTGLAWVSVSAGNSIIQGGNIFGAPVVIGTKDNFSVEILLNNVLAWEFEANGELKALLTEGHIAVNEAATGLHLRSVQSPTGGFGIAAGGLPYLQAPSGTQLSLTSSAVNTNSSILPTLSNLTLGSVASPFKNVFLGTSAVSPLFSGYDNTINDASAAGNVQLKAGNKTVGTGNGGSTALLGGNSFQGSGGNVSILAGAPSDAAGLAGGSVTIQSGNGQAASSTAGSIVLNAGHLIGDTATASKQGSIQLNVYNSNLDSTVNGLTIAVATPTLDSAVQASLHVNAQSLSTVLNANATRATADLYLSGAHFEQLDNNAGTLSKTNYVVNTFQKVTNFTEIVLGESSPPVAPVAGGLRWNGSFLQYSDGTAWIGVAPIVGVVAWRRFVISYSALAAAANTNDIELFSATAGTVITGIVIKHSQSFTGGSLSGYSVSVGLTGDLDTLATAFNVFQAPSESAKQSTGEVVALNSGSTTSVRVAAISTGATLDQASSGSVTIWVQTSILP